MVAMAAALIMAGGVALAETVACDSAPPCYGTPEGDEIDGTASGETIYALGGEDVVFAGEGNDFVTYDLALDTVKACETKNAV